MIAEDDVVQSIRASADWTMPIVSILYPGRPAMSEAIIEATLGTIGEIPDPRLKPYRDTIATAMKTTLAMTIGSSATIEDSGEKVSDADLRADPTISTLMKFHNVANKLRVTSASRIRPRDSLLVELESALLGLAIDADAWSVVILVKGTRSLNCTGV
eukprot:6096336-Amphidinium_carterae.1